MPEKLTSGQPMDTYAGTCGYTEYGNPAPSAVENVAMPLVGEKTATGPGTYGIGDWPSAIGGETKGGDKSVPMTQANNAMQDMTGPR